MSHPSFSQRLTRRAAATVLALLPLFLGGWITGPQSTFDTQGPVARAQTGLFYVTLWVTMIIFVIVASVLAYATLKFKARNSADEHAEPPPQGHGNPLVELSLIGASVLALVVIAVPTLKAIWFTYDVPDAERVNAYEVNATGYQWWFRFDYPAEQIEKSGDLVCANELVIPAGRAVRVNLRTNDVIHSFWVPKLAGKVDMVPNRGNHLWLKADKPGYFWGQCAEYCGESHAVMRFRVIALDEKDFADWLAREKSPARDVAPPAPEAAKAQFASFTAPKLERNVPGWSADFDSDPMAHWVDMQFPNKDENAALIAQGRQLFQSKTCQNCHTIRGHGPSGVTAPDLTHVGSRTTIAGGLLENTDQNLYRWIRDPELVKPGNKMYMGIGGMAGYMKLDSHGDIAVDEEGNQIHNITVSDEEARALVAYLHSLK